MEGPNCSENSREGFGWLFAIERLFRSPRTEQVKTGQVNLDRLSGHFRGHFPWAPSWDASWELSWGVLKGLKTGKINPCGCCRGHCRGHSCGRSRGHTRAPTRGSTRGSNFAFACSARRPGGLAFATEAIPTRKLGRPPPHDFYQSDFLCLSDERIC